MKVKLIVFLCVALLPYNIYATDSESDEGSDDSGLEGVDLINQIAEQGQDLNGIFKPAKNGYLGEGNFGFTYKGMLLRPTRCPVAMKFTPYANKHDAMEEYEIYTYLGSVNVPNIELYGIPRVYFFGKWEDYMLMAITLLDPSFQNRAKAGQLSEVDILIAFREFVRISKYIHSRGIQHNDIHYENLMFRLDRGFIIDYNMAHQMFGDGGIVLPPGAFAQRRQIAREDWKIFLFSMCKVLGVPLAWFDESQFDHLPQQDMDLLIEHLQQDVPTIMGQLSNIPSNALRKIYMEFAALALADQVQSRNANDRECFYDYFYRIIDAEIENLVPQGPAMVSWLPLTQRNAALQHLQTHPTPPISSIPNPFAIHAFDYPQVDYRHFLRRPSSSSQPGESSGSRRR